MGKLGATKDVCEFHWISIHPDRFLSNSDHDQGVLKNTDSIVNKEINDLCYI